MSDGDFDFTPPPAMELEQPLQAVATGSRYRIAEGLSKGCWHCRCVVARLTRRTNGAGAKTIGIQCIGCGKQIGDALPLQDHPDRENYPLWDGSLHALHHESAIAANPIGPPPPQPEDQVSEFFRRQLIRLTNEGRCVWRAEVQLEGWTHAANTKMQRLRIDYLAQLDDGPIIGFEVKRRPDQAADIGRFGLQAHQYVTSQVLPSADIPVDWHGAHLAAVFLVVGRKDISVSVKEHLANAERILGPFRIGFARFTSPKEIIAGHPGLSLWLTGERWWSEHYKYRANIERAVRSGNGKIKVPDPAPETENVE